MNIYNPKSISQIIEETFRPTRLYVKELAGIKYFGKTTILNIMKYPGSGKIWKDRIKKYGKENIKTLWVSDWFYCPYHIQQFALMISELNQIVESSGWANYKPEDGLSGGAYGKVSEKTRQKQSDATKGKPKSTEHNEKNRAGQIRRWSNNTISEETRDKLKKRNKRVWTDEARAEIRQLVKGKLWWNNGIEQRRSKESPGLGWINGRLCNVKCINTV